MAAVDINALIDWVQIEYPFSDCPYVGLRRALCLQSGQPLIDMSGVFADRVQSSPNIIAGFGMTLAFDQQCPFH